ncbi:MAG: amidase [Firmicutes bacterium]|nr:amidase [Bacillota bacterium]
MDLIYLSAKQIAKMIKLGKISSEEIIKKQLKRIEKVNPKLNGMVKKNEKVLDEARKYDKYRSEGNILGPLHGVPITIKDSFNTKDITTTYGTLGKKNYIPNYDATVVDKLKKAGAIILGKTNTPELTLIFETNNLVYGKTNNPYDINKTPGGSSGGEAAMISSGASYIGLGSDTGGSIRLPAHFCGLAGLKPTVGRVSRYGHIVGFGGLLDSLTQIGPLARYVEDLSLVFNVINGYDYNDPSTIDMEVRDFKSVDLNSLNGAYFIDNKIMTPTNDIKHTLKDVVKYLEGKVNNISLHRPENISNIDKLYGRIFSADGGKWIRDTINRLETKKVHPSLKWAFDTDKSSNLTVSKYSELIKDLDQLKLKMEKFLNRYDFLICPVNAKPAIEHGKTLNRENRKSFSYTKLFNLTGNPAVVVRTGTSKKKLPIGVQIISRKYREDICLKVAYEIEKNIGGWKEPNI